MIGFNLWESMVTGTLGIPLQGIAKYWVTRTEIQNEQGLTIWEVIDCLL